MDKHDINISPSPAEIRRQALTILANRSSFRHILDAFVCVFNFEFIAAIGCIVWAVEKPFKIGDYNPNGGFFYKEGALPSPPENPPN